MHYSSIARRIAAMFLDGLITAIPVAIAAHVIPFLGAFILVFFYYPVFESSRLQATIGKNLMGIQVTGTAGERLNYRAACVRLFMKLISMTFLFAGHFLAFFTEKRQTFHDLVAGSVVTYGRSEVPVADAWIEQVRAIFGA
jgi:uncharacterized RDD family membrane protein YckC